MELEVELEVVGKGGVSAASFAALLSPARYERYEQVTTAAAAAAATRPCCSANIVRLVNFTPRGEIHESISLVTVTNSFYLLHEHHSGSAAHLYTAIGSFSGAGPGRSSDGYKG